MPLQPVAPDSPLQTAARQVLGQYFPPVATSVPRELAGGGFSGAVVLRLHSSGGPGDFGNRDAGRGNTGSHSGNAGSEQVLRIGEMARRMEDAAAGMAGLPERWCLRRWPAGTNARRIAALHRFVEWLWSSGADVVARPVKSRGGQSLLSMGGHLWQVEPWLPGQADFHRNPAPTRLQAVMRLLARMHQLAAAYRAPATDQTWFGPATTGPSNVVRERQTLLERWSRGGFALAEQAVQRGSRTAEPLGLPELAAGVIAASRRLADRVLGELSRAAGWQVPLLPVLRDVWHDHVLWTGDRVTGLIDLSAAGRETVAADLSRLLGSLVGDEMPAWQTAMNEYRQLRALTPEEESLVPILDRSGVLLSAMNWIDRHYLQNSGSLHQPAARARLSRLAARLDHMLHFA